MLHISPNHMLGPTILLPQLGFSTKSTYALIINIFILSAINTLKNNIINIDITCWSLVQFSASVEISLSVI